MTYYFLSLGSNISPEENIWKILDRLTALLGRLDISSIEQTEAIGFQTEHYFLNLCVRIHSELSPETLKTELIKIETDLGRDRAHPDSSSSDRPADIDILFSVRDNEQFIADALIPKEAYVLPTFIELARCLGYDFTAAASGIKKGRSLEREGHIIGDMVKAYEMPHPA